MNEPFPPTWPKPVHEKRQRSIDILEAAAGWTEQLQQLGQSNSSSRSTGSSTPRSQESSWKRPQPDEDHDRIHDLFENIDIDVEANKGSWEKYAAFYTQQSEASLIHDEQQTDMLSPADNGEKKGPPQPPPPTSTLPAPTHFTPRDALFIFNICLAQLLSLAGLALTVAPVVSLSQTFNFNNPGQTAWPTAAYSLTLGCFILPAGRLGDMFGHKHIFVIGWIWFAIASLGCGFTYMGNASSKLIACRAIQGIGPALCVPNGLAIFGKTFPIGLKRNIAMCLFAGSGPIGFVVGAVLTSLLTQLEWWPCVYWLIAILCGVTSVMSYYVIPQDSIKLFAKPGTRSWADFDLLGALTGVGGLVLINFALNQAPIVDWDTPYIGVCLGIGVILMCCFMYVELYRATYPLIPIKRLHRNAALTLACIAAGWGSHGIWLYYMFLLLEQIRGETALSACARIWPVAPVGMTAAVAVAFLQKKIKVPYLMSIAMSCFLIGSLLLATAPPHQTYYANTLISILITPIGMNWSFSTGVILMAGAVPRENQGIAASLVSTMVNYSISTGLGFAGSIDRHVAPTHGVLAGYRGAWYFGVGLSGLGILISMYFIWQSKAKK